MKAREVARAVTVMVVGSGAQLISNLLAAIAATAWLQINERGVMVTIMAIAGLASVFGTLGVGSAFRALRPRELKSARGLGMSYLAAGAIATLLASSLAVGAMVVLDVTSSPGLASPSNIASVTAATISLAGLTLVSDLRLANGLYAASGRWAALGATAGLAGLILAWAWLPLSAAALVMGQSLGLAIVLIASIVVAIRSGVVALAPLEMRAIGRLLRTGAGMLVLPASLALLTRADRIILEATSTSAAVAVYALAATYVEVLRIVPTAIGQFASRMVATGAALRSVLKLCFASVVAASILGIFVVLIATIITEPLFGAEYADSVAVTLWLLPAELGFAVLVVVNLVLIGGMWSKSATLLGLAAASVGVAAYSAGAVFGGVAGLALARDCTMVLVAVVAVLLAVILHRRRDRDTPEKTVTE